MRNQFSCSPACAKFRTTILTALIVASLGACSSGGTGGTDGASVSGVLPEPQTAQANTPQYFALPGINYTRIERKGDALAFTSQNSPGFEATTSSTDEVAIAWPEDDDAAVYEVYRRDSDARMLNDQLCHDGEVSQEDTFILLDIAPTNEYRDATITGNRRYEYRVVAVDDNNEKNTIASGLTVSIQEAQAVIAVALASSEEVTTPAAPTPAAALPPPTEPSIPTGNTETAAVITDSTELANAIETAREAPATPLAVSAPEPAAPVSAPEPVTTSAPAAAPSEPLSVESPEPAPVITPVPPPVSILEPAAVPEPISTPEPAPVASPEPVDQSILGNGCEEPKAVIVTNEPDDVEPTTTAGNAPDEPEPDNQLVSGGNGGEEDTPAIEPPADIVEPTLGAAYDASFWDMSVEPPELIDPVLIEMSNAYETVAKDDNDRVGCEGLIHRIDLPSGVDALITMAEGAEALIYPIYVFGGRNVHVRGLEMRTAVQPGCDVGEAHQIRNSIPNIHPRLVGNKVFRFEQSHTTFIEGVDIDLRGQEADCFVMRNPSSLSKEQAIQQRHFHIVNTRCTGIEGLDDSPIGDGIHGDFFQNQGKDNLSSFIVENVTFRTSSNGITLHNWNGSTYRPRLFKMRNMDYGWDERYDDDDAYEISGLAYSAHGNVFEFEEVWLNHPRNGNYGFLNGERVGAISHGSYITKAAGMYEGTPPGGDFAPEDKVGIGYVTPFE